MDKEAKRQNFEKKAYAKVEKIKNQIKGLQNFSHREWYDYSALEVMTFFADIEATLNETRNKFIYELQREEGVYYIEEEDDFEDDDEE